MRGARQADVIVRAREPGGSSCGPHGARAVPVRDNGDLRLREQPEHVAHAIVGGPDALAGHAPARERHRARHFEQSIPVLVRGLVCGHGDAVARLEPHLLGETRRADVLPFSRRQLRLSGRDADRAAVPVGQRDRHVDALDAPAFVHVLAFALDAREELPRPVDSFADAGAALDERRLVRARDRRGGRRCPGALAHRQHDECREEEHERGYRHPGRFLPAHRHEC